MTQVVGKSSSNIITVLGRRVAVRTGDRTCDGWMLHLKIRINILSFLPSMLGSMVESPPLA